MSQFFVSKTVDKAGTPQVSLTDREGAIYRSINVDRMTEGEAAIFMVGRAVVTFGAEREDIKISPELVEAIES